MSKVFLSGLSVVDSRVSSFDDYPYNLPFVRDLALRFTRPVTFLVGENGSGKSTIIEAVAELCGFPVSGGGRNDAGAQHGPEERSALASVLRPSFIRRPPDGYFLRAEFQAHFASLLEQRREDPHFSGDPYGRYGGRSLHEQSHGEAFLAVIQNRMSAGLFIMDEPEAALSPQRQLTLLARMAEMVGEGRTQFIVATHSPILLTYPDADIVSLDQCPPATVALEDTAHFQITLGILQNPQRYWKHLLRKADEPDEPG